MNTEKKKGKISMYFISSKVNHYYVLYCHFSIETVTQVIGACGSNVKEICKHILEIFQCDVHRMRRSFFPEEVSSTKCSL